VSWEALDWAGRQRTRACSTQVVLYVLANAADPDGVAMGWWTRDEHWWRYLMDRTRLKRASLFRIMDELASVGALTLEWRVPTEGGRKRAVVHLNLSVTIVENGENESTSETPADDAAEAPQPIESTSEIPAEKLVHDGDRIESTTETGSHTNPKKIPTSPKPPSGALPSEVDEKAARQSFERFRQERYPYPIEDEAKTWARWRKLAPADWEIRIGAIAVWTAEQKKRSKTSTPLQAHRWLGDGMQSQPGKWQGYAAQAQGKTAVGMATRYDPTSREGRAIMTLCRIARYDPLLASGTVAIPHPMTAQLLALADAPPFEEWQTFVQRTQPFGAWVEMTRTYLAGRALRALTEVRAPWLFPPKLDGTIYDGASIQPESPDQAAADLAESEGYR
jgi:hypothetical protein